MSKIVVLHAPLKAPEARKHPLRVVNGIRKYSPHFAGPSEAYGIVVPLAKMRGFRCVLEEGGKDKRRGQKDNPILVDKNLVSRGSGQIWGCAASEPLRIAPERWFSFAVCEIPGRQRPHCHITLHPHAGVQGEQGRAPDSDRGRKFLQQMQNFNTILTWAQAMGWTITVSGDVNFVDKMDLRYSPYTIMRDHNMDTYSQHFDVIGWTRSLDMEVTEVAAPKGVTDHPWLKGVSRG